MRNATYALINAALANANINSAALPINGIYAFSAQIVIPSGTATGTLQLQASNDFSVATINNPIFVPTNWGNIGLSTSITTTTSAYMLQSTGFTKFDAAFQWLRAVYTDGSSGMGTGLLTVQINIQGF